MNSYLAECLDAFDLFTYRRRDAGGTRRFAKDIDAPQLHAERRVFARAALYFKLPPALVCSEDIGTLSSEDPLARHGARRSGAQLDAPRGKPSRVYVERARSRGGGSGEAAESDR